MSLGDEALSMKYTQVTETVQSHLQDWKFTWRQQSNISMNEILMRSSVYLTLVTFASII
jgi:predicted lysophospholipase L1 biosynthesis ABC-type transport system permease subunit